VFASGRGTNFEALVEAARRGALGGTIVVLCCDRPGALAMDRAHRHGIEAIQPPTGGARTRIVDERPWLEALRARAVDIVLLAGFMRRLQATLLDAFPDRIVNIHPSLLPAHPGLDAIGQTWRAGDAEGGCTVHLVNAELDAGAILGQQVVERRPDDTLETFEARVHDAEHALYPAVVRRMLTARWHRAGGRVVWDGTPAGRA